MLSCEVKDKDCDDHASLEKPFAGLMQDVGVCDHECLYALAGGVKRYHTLMAEGDFASPGEKSEKTYDTARGYLAGMGVSPAVLEDAAAVTTDLPLHLVRPRLLDYGFGTQTASPGFLADTFTCKGSAPLLNCVLRDERRQVTAAKPAETSTPTPPATVPAKKRAAKPHPRQVIIYGGL